MSFHRRCGAPEDIPRTQVKNLTCGPKSEGFVVFKPRHSRFKICKNELDCYFIPFYDLQI